MLNTKLIINLLGLMINIFSNSLKLFIHETLAKESKNIYIVLKFLIEVFILRKVIDHIKAKET